MRTYTSPTKISWERMKSRCDYKGDPNYSKYGGRGIAYDTKWGLFKNFLSDMGERPSGTTLDRRDGAGNYTKDNCRWATSKEQAYNKKNTIFITVGGVTKNTLEWSLETGIPVGLIRDRYLHGWRGAECFVTHRQGRFGRVGRLTAPRVA